MELNMNWPMDMEYTIETSFTGANGHFTNNTYDTTDPNITVDIGQQNPTKDNSLGINTVPSNRKMKNHDELTDPIFKLPFEHGWSREIHHRSTKSKRRTLDIYYHHDSNPKSRYRSLKEVQRFLKLSTTENTPLTKDNFTFRQQPIGISDASKEFHTGISKPPFVLDINSPDPMALRSNEDSSKIRIVENTNELNEPSTPKYQKSNLEATPFGSNHVHDVQSSFISSHVHDVQSSFISNHVHDDQSSFISNRIDSEALSCNIQKLLEVEVDEDVEVHREVEVDEDVEVHREVEVDEDVEVHREVEVDEDVEVHKDVDVHKDVNVHKDIEVREVLQLSMSTVKALKQVFSYLNVKDILSVSRVCSMWNLIAMHSTSWKSVCLKDTRVYDWYSCVNMLNSQGTVKLYADHMIIPKDDTQVKDFWLTFSGEIRRATHLKVLKIHKPPTFVISEVFGSLFQLEVFHATHITSYSFMMNGKTNFSRIVLNLDELFKMKNLNELKLETSNKICLDLLPTFSNLTNLKSLAFTSITHFPINMELSFNTLSTGLKVLEIGDCNYLPNNFGSIIQRLVNLKSLRLENYDAKCNYISNIDYYDVFASIGDHPKLKVLELVNITLCSCVESSVRKWKGLRSLMIDPARNNFSSTTKRVMKCVGQLFRTLTHFVYCIKIPSLSLIQELLKKSTVLEPLVSNAPDRLVTVVCFPETTDVINILFTDVCSVETLASALRNIFDKTCTIVIKASLGEASQVYITDHFDDIM